MVFEMMLLCRLSSDVCAILYRLTHGQILIKLVTGVYFGYISERVFHFFKLSYHTIWTQIIVGTKTIHLKFFSKFREM